MPVLDEILDKFSVFSVDFLLVFSKTYSRAVDNGDIFAHVLYIFDGTDSVFIKVDFHCA